MGWLRRCDRAGPVRSLRFQIVSTALKLHRQFEGTPIESGIQSSAREINMKHIVVTLAALMGCAVIATPAGMSNSLTGKEKAEGWKLLFDGKSLDQWDLSTSLMAQWKAVDGTIVTDSKQGGTLLSKGDFANFELKVEFRTTDNVNSGVILRNPRPDASKKGGGGQGYEVQIRDKDPGHYSGGSYLTG